MIISPQNREVFIADVCMVGGGGGGGGQVLAPKPNKNF